MKNITYPTTLFDRPFSDTGNKQIIPENQSGSGRASLVNGFPTETQLPLNQGGIAPNRLDFNGAFYMLSAMAFWQQSGGMWQWDAALNYTTPCLVFHSANLWWCIQDNGPQAPNAAAVEPGTDETYWIEFLQALGKMSGGGGGLIPVGAIVPFKRITAPDGWLVCDGTTFSATTYPVLYAELGEARTPDMRGLFVRGYDPSGTNDPDGIGRNLGTVQGDAIRNIEGTLGGTMQIGSQGGPIVWTPTPQQLWTHGNGYNVFNLASFDASRAVPTADENRPKNINLLYCIKHD